MTEIQHVTPQEAWELTQQGTLLVDVRETDEVSQKRYDTSSYLHLALSTLPENFTQIPTNEKVIIGCRSGVRSQKAIDFLLSQGYTHLANLEGGILAWEEAGLLVI